jgi:hypothetical protein
MQYWDCSFIINVVPVWSELVLKLWRMGQSLVMVSNAPLINGDGMFPQLGAPIGLLLSGGFLILTDTMSSETFLDYGWRIPYSSSLLVVVSFLSD